MSDDLIIKKEELANNLQDLMKLVNKLEPSQSIKFYENLISTLKADLEKIEHPTENCSTCGSPLDPWEKDRCGPCKIADEKIPEERD
ncbi:MAG: hypothetical protein GTN35_04770 [Nitrososphaeria archaeon]|nr:hypothetical protein [Nitrosopumilaceae archaeon]NIP09163.1 hypothetical protein [Nitrosopumilaceae archaeon]NIP91691.1 hypothetical protein [Nitrososphaeria archaeon]NIS95531.1 hypothetical protein [Nitrosopumilaceae archaeon]